AAHQGAPRAPRLTARSSHGRHVHWRAMAENSTHKGATLAKLVATVVLAGALAAGLALPEVGGLGLAARNSADIINGLPDQLTINPPAGNTKVLAADGSLITEYYSNNRIPVTSDQIATVMKQAQADIED